MSERLDDERPTRTAARLPARRRLVPARRRERGSVVLWVLLMLTILLTFGAFAIDVPRVAAVRNELQNAADAAALARAAVLASGSSRPPWTNSASANTAAGSLDAS